MARYTGSKNKLQRALGKDLSLKTNAVKIIRRLQIPVGQHGPKGSRGKTSDYKMQLKEKQKVKWIYGVLEKQFRSYYNEARKDPKATGTKMLQLLEFRLDNVIYRLGFAPTRAAARQFITHGHVMVNSKKLDIPSYQVRINETVSINTKIADNPDVKKGLEDKKVILPKWLDRKALVGKIVREPERDEIEGDIAEQLIVEYYSR